MSKIVIGTPPCCICHNRGKVEVNKIEYDNWQSSDLLIQEAMPTTDADTREQLISGTHPACYEKLFGKEE